MGVKTVVRIKHGEARLVSTEREKEFREGLRKDIADGTLRVVRQDDEPGAVAQGSGPCEEFCEEHDGVDICGAHVVLCNDGTSGVIRG